MQSFPVYFIGFIGENGVNTPEASSSDSTTKTIEISRMKTQHLNEFLTLYLYVGMFLDELYKFVFIAYWINMMAKKVTFEDLDFAYKL